MLGQGRRRIGLVFVLCVCAGMVFLGGVYLRVESEVVNASDVFGRGLPVS